MAAACGRYVGNVKEVLCIVIRMASLRQAGYGFPKTRSLSRDVMSLFFAAGLLLSKNTTFLIKGAQFSGANSTYLRFGTILGALPCLFPGGAVFVAPVEFCQGHMSPMVD